MKNITFNKVAAIIIGLIVLFIPTFIAVASYNAEKPPVTVINNVTTLTIQDPEGRSFTVTSDNDPANVIEMFNSINQSL